MSAMTDSQLDLLRGLPSDNEWSYGGEHSDAQIEFDGSPWIELNYDAIRRTPAADVLLATLDSAVAAERERVLADVDEATAPGKRTVAIGKALADAINASANPQGETDQ